jgi:hypothetical protein
MTRQPDTPEIDRLRDRLHLLFRLLDVTFKQVESANDLGFGHFSKVFNGSRDFRLEHLLFFCQATGLHPAEFFHWVYPRLPTVPSEAARKLYALQDELIGASRPALPASPAGPVQLSPAQLQRLSEGARREILQLLEGGNPAPGPEAWSDDEDDETALPQPPLPSKASRRA